jgi:Flp pilus assembly protein TadD
MAESPLLNPSDGGRGAVDQWSELGFLLLAQGDGAGAEKAFRQAIRTGSPVGWTGLGDVCTTRGEHDDAREMYRRAAGTA